MTNSHHRHPLRRDPSKNSLPYVLCICGPTASGKTSLSIEIAKHFPAEIINADIGQFYKDLSIGTAKPDWRAQPTPHHLFDIVDTPSDMSAKQYRSLVIEMVQHVWAREKLPIIVGGSLFYIKTLFYPLIELPEAACRPHQADHDASWERLCQIDPDRAQAIHPNDTYRIQRALAIWRQTGKKPSEYTPQLDPPFHSRIIFLDWPRSALFERINQRTDEMLAHGWIQETRGLAKQWQKFLEKKRLIGYPEIFDWIERGEPSDDLNNLIAEIQRNTRNYAKRQVTFWKKFRNIVELQRPQVPRILCEPTGVAAEKELGKVCQAVIKSVKDDLGAL